MTEKKMLADAKDPRSYGSTLSQARADFKTEKTHLLASLTKSYTMNTMMMILLLLNNYLLMSMLKTIKIMPI